jgi:hypothetical protein
MSIVITIKIEREYKICLKRLVYRIVYVNSVWNVGNSYGLCGPNVSGEVRASPATIFWSWHTGLLPGFHM